MHSKVKNPDEQENIEYSLDMRLALLIQSTLGHKNDWKRLEIMSGINSVRWRHFYSGATKPSADMLEFFFTQYPQHAFWLATGLTDYEAGHTAPQVNLAFPGALEGGFQPLPANQQATESYFKECLDALKQCWTAWINHVQRTAKRQLNKQDLVRLYALGINTSLQIGASELTTALGKQEQERLIESLSQARDEHLDHVISRVRSHWDEADAIIDRQRSSDADLIAEFEDEERLNTKKVKKE